MWPLFLSSSEIYFKGIWKKIVIVTSLYRNMRKIHICIYTCVYIYTYIYIYETNLRIYNIKEEHHVSMWLSYLCVLSLIWSAILLVMNDSQLRLKFGVCPSKMENIIILKICLCVSMYACIFKLTGPWGRTRRQPVICSAGSFVSVSHGGQAVQGVGGNLPHQTTLMIAHQVGQQGQFFSISAPKPQWHFAKG